MPGVDAAEASAGLSPGLPPSPSAWHRVATLATVAQPGEVRSVSLGAEQDWSQPRLWRPLLRVGFMW